MTSENSACQTLLGEKLGSIRSIHYLPDSDSATPATPGALEIETKTGRFVHIVPTDHNACRIVTGPVPAPATQPQPLLRCWQDLTSQIPFAFDGRPVVARVTPMAADGRTSACIIEFSNGGRIEYAVFAGEPRLVTGSV